MKYLLSILCLFVLSCDEDDASYDDLCSSDYMHLWGEYYDIESTTEAYIVLESGVIPDELECLVNLEVLTFDGGTVNMNTLNWEVITNLQNLIELHMTYDFYGEIPPEIGDLTNLFILDIWDTNITGEIPPEIGNLTNLTQLKLSGLWNNPGELTGEIPPEIGNLTNLTYLHLYNNQFSGEIPSEIGNLTNLTQLYLLNNQLTGEIPPEIGQLTNLTELWLYHNQLTGDIPIEVCNLIENNNLDINNILDGNSLNNTCP